MKSYILSGASMADAGCLMEGGRPDEKVTVSSLSGQWEDMKSNSWGLGFYWKIYASTSLSTSGLSDVG